MQFLNHDQLLYFKGSALQSQRVMEGSDESLIKRVKENRVESLSESPRACHEYGELIQFNIDHNQSPAPRIKKKKKNTPQNYTQWVVTGGDKQPAAFPASFHFIACSAVHAPSLRINHVAKAGEILQRCRWKRFWPGVSASPRLDFKETNKQASRMARSF